MPTFLGSTDITKAYVGPDDASKAYLGSALVRDSAAPVGPLVAMWDFEGAEPEKDIVSGRTLSLGSNIEVVDLGGIKALGAPSASGSATAPDGFLNQSGFTVAFWLYTPPTAENTRVAFLSGATTVAELYGGWRNLAGTIYEVNRVLVVTDTGSYNRVQQTSVGSSIPAQQWRHVVGTYDGAALTLYSNGVQRNTGAKDGLVSDPDGFTIDVIAGSLVKNVGIWNRALDSTEVADLYAAGV